MQISGKAFSNSLAMALLRPFIILFMLHLTVYVIGKIVLPHNLRYLENMLNSEVVAKAAKIRQRIEANPNSQDGGKGWPMLLAKYQAENKENNYYNKNAYDDIYNRRYPNF